MEKAGTARKATVVTGTSHRQRGLKHRTAKAAPAPAQGWAIVHGATVWDPWCDLQLNPAVPGPLQMCRLPAMAHLQYGRKREEEHAWNWSMLCRDEGLQNPWHAVSRIYMEVAEGDSRHGDTNPDLCRGTQRQERSKGWPRGLCLCTSWHHAHLWLTALLLLPTPIERGAPEETGGTSGPTEAMHVLWPFRRLVRHPITMLKSWNTTKAQASTQPKCLFQFES